MPKRSVETLETLPALTHNFQTNPAPATWNKKAKVDDKDDKDEKDEKDEKNAEDSDSDEEMAAEEPEYRTATLPVTDVGATPVPPPKCPSSSSVQQVGQGIPQQIGQQVVSPVRPIRVRNKSSDDTIWLLKFEAVKEYVAIHGNSNIQTNYECSLPNVDGKCKLGIWLNRQKFNKKSGVLRDDRFALLDQLVQEGKLSWPGDTPGVTGEPVEVLAGPNSIPYNIGVSDDAAWIQKVNLLKSLSRDGNSNITSSYVSSLTDGTTVRLGLWLKKQRQMRKGGMLKPNREAILQQMVDEGKLTWSSIRAAVVIRGLQDHQGKLTDDEIWDLKLMALVNYITENQEGGGGTVGTGTIPINCMVDINGSEVRLGLWLKKQRQMYRNNSLRADRKERLQVLVDR